MNEDNNNEKKDNTFILTNKSNIEKKEILNEEEQEKKDLKFLYQIIGQNLKLSNIKQDIGIFLELTDYIFNDIKAISEEGKKIKNKQNNTKQKINYESMYINKVKCFKDNLELFQKKICFIKEKNIGFNIIFEYLKRQKEYGFILDEKFDINDNNMILDLDQLIIQHKWIKNFEELIDIKNKNFKLIYEDNGKCFLKSDFIDYYNKKYILNFIFEIKYNNIYTVSIHNELFENYLKNHIIIDKKINENSDLIIFYIKYLLYKFFKEEINAFRKHIKNDSKETIFENNGLTFLIKKYPNNISIKCYYFDNIEINFSISKTEKNKHKLYPSYYYCRFPNKMNNKFIQINDFNDRNISNYNILNYSVKFIKIFLNNILFDIKYSKNITNFISEVKRNSNLTLENIIKNSIFVKNITNIGLILLNYYITRFIIEKKFIYSHFLNIHKTLLGRLEFFWEFYEKGVKLFYIIEMNFDNDLNLNISLKESYKNLIFTLDTTQYIIAEKGKINFNYLYDILSSIANMNIINDKNKSYMRNLHYNK